MPVLMKRLIHTTPLTHQEMNHHDPGLTSGSWQRHPFCSTHHTLEVWTSMPSLQCLQKRVQLHSVLKTGALMGLSLNVMNTCVNLKISN